MQNTADGTPEGLRVPNRQARWDFRRVGRNALDTSNQDLGDGAQTENQAQTENEAIQQPTPDQTGRAQTLTWRRRAAPPSNTRPARQQQPGQPRAPAQYNPYGRKLDPEAFRPGAVISLACHHPNIEPDGYPPREVDPGNNKTLTYIGAWVYSKFRKVIIIHRYPNHCVAVPIFSHQDRGLRSRRDRVERIGVRDSEDVENANVTDSPHRNIIIVRTDHYRVTNTESFHHWTRPTSYAHFTAPINVDISVPAFLDGYIQTEDQLQRLIDLHCGAYSRSPEEQQPPEAELRRSASLSEEELSKEEELGEAEQTLHDARMAQAAQLDRAARTFREAQARAVQAREGQMNPQAPIYQQAQMQADQAQLAHQGQINQQAQMAQQARTAQQPPYGPPPPGIEGWGPPIPGVPPPPGIAGWRPPVPGGPPPPGIVPWGAPVPVGPPFIVYDENIFPQPPYGPAP